MVSQDSMLKMFNVNEFSENIYQYLFNNKIITDIQIPIDKIWHNSPNAHLHHESIRKVIDGIIFLANTLTNLTDIKSKLGNFKDAADHSYYDTDPKRVVAIYSNNKLIDFFTGKLLSVNEPLDIEHVLPKVLIKKLAYGSRENRLANFLQDFCRFCPGSQVWSCKIENQDWGDKSRSPNTRRIFISSMYSYYIPLTVGFRYIEITTIV